LPLKDDFTINADDYIGIPETVFIANPNAQTGISLPVCEIERIVSSNPGRVVVVDEAYVDFGGESSVKLINKYQNLVVISTFSKSRSLAGGRLGFVIADKELITDLNTVRYSFNPYNVNRLTMAAATAAVKDVNYYAERVKEIVRVRGETREALLSRGFYVTNSRANFLLAGCKDISGQELYSKLREMGVLVRVFPDERIKDYIRVTIGSDEQMKKFVSCIDVILKETVASGGKLR
jgi:histidinol-phosphate aminotransferase